MEVPPSANIIPEVDPNQNLICPSCKKSTPYISPIIDGKHQVSLKIQCSCTNTPIIIDIEDYFQQIKQSLNKEPLSLSSSKPHCYNNLHTKPAEKYCLNCLKWLCPDCIICHLDFLKDHFLMETEPINVNQGENQGYHSTQGETYQAEGYSSITSSDTNLKPIDDLSPYFNDNINNIETMLKTTHNQINSFNLKIEKVVSYFIQLKQKINNQFQEYNKANTRLIQLSYMIRNTWVNFNKQPNHALYQTIKAFTASVFREICMDFRELKESYAVVSNHPTLIDSFSTSLFRSPLPIFVTSTLIDENQSYEERCFALVAPYLVKKYGITKADAKIFPNLVYDSKRDGDTAKEFHKQLENKMNTLIIIKTKQGNVFGGYTTKLWNTGWKSKYMEDENAFLFSLDMKKIYPIKSSMKEYALYLNSDSGPIFGKKSNDTHDLQVPDKFLTYGAYCNFPGTFENGDINEFNKNENYFAIQEMKAYTINFL